MCVGGGGGGGDSYVGVLEKAKDSFFVQPILFVFCHK